MQDIRRILLRLSFLYYLNNICSGTCVDGSDNCAACADDDLCSTCSSTAYYVTGETCTACTDIANCSTLTCTSASD